MKHSDRKKLCYYKEIIALINVNVTFVFMKIKLPFEPWVLVDVLEVIRKGNVIVKMVRKFRFHLFKKIFIGVSLTYNVVHFRCTAKRNQLYPSSLPPKSKLSAFGLRPFFFFGVTNSAGTFCLLSWCFLIFLQSKGEGK